MTGAIVAKRGPKPTYPGGARVWYQRDSAILCKCGCGRFVTNRAAKNIERGKPNAGYVRGHANRGKTFPHRADGQKGKKRKYKAGFRKKTRERDKGCVLCGNRSRLEVHHVSPGLDISNCVTLCKSCRARASSPRHKERIAPMLKAYLDGIA